MNKPRAVVTGASSGIGAETARRLSAEYEVVCVARRLERVEDLAAEIGGIAVGADVSKADEVAHLAKVAGPKVRLLVNNAGGARGQETVAEADFDHWQEMYDSNVIGAGRVTKALLPAVTAAEGTIVFVTSVAADGGYEGGAGYCGAKAAERSMVQAMRLELVGTPVRICEVVPGMVKTEEFSLKRFDGDRAKADKVYEGVPGPLVAADIADAICWIASRPDHVNIDRLTIRPRAQAAQHKVFRTS